MNRQMDIFDFIEKPLESKQRPFRPQFEQLFEKVRDLACLCANCLCEFCVNNAEQSLDRVKPGEMQEPCFNCDEYRVYDRDYRKQNQLKEECTKFVMSDYGAKSNRKRIKLVGLSYKHKSVWNRCTKSWSKDKNDG